MTKIIPLLIFCFLTSGLFAQKEPAGENNIYLPISVKYKADFDYNKLKNIDSLTPPYPKGGSFMIGDIPIKRGSYIIYKFIAPFISSFHDEPTKKIVFHNMLAVKADKNGNILDAYHYTLEWQDIPSLRLYKMQAKDLKLSRYMELSQLKLTNTEGEVTAYQGILDDFYRSKRLFPAAQSTGKKMSLNLNPKFLRVQAGKVIYEPDSQVKKSSYSYYYFEQDEFELKIGKLPLSERKTIQIEITRTEKKNHTPSDPRAQSPAGGFELTYYYCKIIK